jgi:hypothetical protein
MSPGSAHVARVGAGSFASQLTADTRRCSLVTSEIRNSIKRQSPARPREVPIQELAAVEELA